MHPLIRSYFAVLGAVAISILLFLLFPQTGLAPTQPAEDRLIIGSPVTHTQLKESPSPAATPVSEAVRIVNPYPFSPQTTDDLTNTAQASLVNIFCVSNNPAFRSSSGSGVLIDPRGVILTNAHVAQYVLLSSLPDLGIVCTIRTGSPAIARWEAQVLYIPPIWVRGHAHEINSFKPASSGEHDYALLLITKSIDDTPPTPFPYLPIDTREAIAFPEDEVATASYPVEFVGGINAPFNLRPASSVSTVSKLYTFTSKTADILSLGEVPLAQSGSSGGLVINTWGFLVGLLTAMSDETAASGRDLRALSLSYIDRDLKVQAGSSLSQILASDMTANMLDFNTSTAPALLALYTNMVGL